MKRVDGDTPLKREDYEVHVLHRNRAEQRLLAENDCPDVTRAILKTNTHRTDVAAHPPFSVCRRDFFLGIRLQTEFVGHIFR